SGTENGRVNRAPQPPRLWCDFCGVFDSHDTKDCYSEPAMLRKAKTAVAASLMTENGQKTTEDAVVIAETVQARIYCENCGVFDDHPTSACENDEMF
ncbi:unnamed protein product, partial [Protopolystoma xenopodis]